MATHKMAEANNVRGARGQEGSVDLRLDAGSETAELQVAGSWEEEHAKYF